MSTMTSEQVSEAALKREQGKPEFARQARQNRSKKSDGGVHAVRRTQARSRLQEAAAHTEVAKPPVKRWQKASALPQLEAPAGLFIEYVRKDNQTRGDLENLVAHLSEGWEFARKSDFPGKVLPTQRLTDHGECIGNASSILMKITTSMKAERDAYYRKRRNAATKAVGEKDPAPEGVSHVSMPIVEDVNRTSSNMQRMKARRSPVRVAADV
jgi:hypothetical protein